MSCRLSTIRNDDKRTWKTPGPGRPKGKSDLSPIQQGRIVGKVLAGLTMRQVAQEEGVHHTTVERVLSRSGWQAMLTEYRSRALQAAPDALEYLHRRVKQGLKARPDVDVPGATQAAIKILEGTLVLARKMDIEVAAGAGDFGRYGRGLYTDKSNEELRYYMKHDRWPSSVELEHYRKTGNWPAETVSQGAGQ